MREALARPRPEAIDRLLATIDMSESARRVAAAEAAALVTSIREALADESPVEALMREYDLGTDEGIVLMCLAEALLRIPDAETRDRLIRDKIGPADWRHHIGHSASPFVNASTWALALTGRTLQLAEGPNIWARLASRLGEPILREAVLRAMRLLGHQFVLGETVDQALDRAKPDERQGARHSYDMLGEAARTMDDADRYLRAYLKAAIGAIGHAAAGRGPIDGPGISVKLSALHPRYEPRQRQRVLAEIAPRLLVLAEAAAAANIGMTIDAEEADRLELSIELLETLLAAPTIAGWNGLGLAIQAYQDVPPSRWSTLLRNAPARPAAPADGPAGEGRLLGYRDQAGTGDRIGDYSVYTRKAATDLSYLAAANRIFAAGDALFGQFATSAPIASLRFADWPAIVPISNSSVSTGWERRFTTALPDRWVGRSPAASMPR